MFGAFQGDVIGSEYENACTKDYDVPFKRESHFTDDSVMTAAVCRAILNNGENIGKFGVRKRAFEYAAQYKQYYSVIPTPATGACLHVGQRRKASGGSTAMLTAVR